MRTVWTLGKVRFLRVLTEGPFSCRIRESRDGHSHDKLDDDGYHEFYCKHLSSIGWPYAAAFRQRVQASDRLLVSPTTLCVYDEPAKSVQHDTVPFYTNRHSFTIPIKQKSCFDNHSAV